jgi:hypothetical protein
MATREGHKANPPSRTVSPLRPNNPLMRGELQTLLKVSIIEEFRDLDKLGQGFTLADPLEEMNIGDGKTLRPTFVNKTLKADHRDEMIGLLKEYSHCFAWSYTEMPRLSRELVEHRLPIKPCFRPFKQRPSQFIWTYSLGSRTKFTGS